MVRHYVTFIPERDMTTSATDPISSRDPYVIWSSLFGVGLLPRAPGTWGSIAAALIWWWTLADLHQLVQALLIVAYFLLSWWAAHVVGRKYKVADASLIVSDEVAGMWVALLMAPRLWWVVVLAFVIFRILDIVKPGPIGWLDRNVKGGLGVMLDDLAAGLITALAVLLVTRFALSAG